MIGQKILLKMLELQIAENTFPRFLILVGQKGSGKKTMCKVIADKLNCTIYTLEDIKVDTIRKMIQDCYKLVNDTVYIIPDADNMSIAAKNALLKVTEEPPNNARFIMTLESENNTLDTVRSRGTIYRMESYTPDEIYEYAKSYSHDNEEIVKELCETPGDVDIFYKTGADFYIFVEKVVDNIAAVSLGNALKIAEQIAFKDEDDKYDLKLFLKAFQKICASKYREGIKYLSAIRVTAETLADLRITGINKNALFDMWVLNIRDLWE